MDLVVEAAVNLERFIVGTNLSKEQVRTSVIDDPICAALEINKGIEILLASSFTRISARIIPAERLAVILPRKTNGSLLY